MLDMIRLGNGPARVLLFASPALHAYARDLGLVPVSRDPDVVAVKRDRAFNYSALASAANAVRGGAELVAANPDRTHPGVGGTVVPETGALLAAIVACVGAIVPRIIGKPEPALFREALARPDATAEGALMIGDNVETDGRGAHGLGMTFHDAASGLDPVLARFTAAEDDREAWGERRIGRR